MRNLALILCLSLLAGIISCGGDSEDCPSPTFKSQTLQGKISGADWIFETGSAEESFFDSEKISIELTDQSFASPCDEFSFGGNVILFSVDNAVGVYTVCFNLDATENQTFTLYDGSTNNIITNGGIEITSISASSVSGKLTGSIDDQNFVDGTFTVPFCQ